MDEPLTLLDLPDLLESFLSSRSVEFSVSAVCAFAYLSADFDFRVAALGSYIPITMCAGGAACPSVRVPRARGCALARDAACHDQIPNK